MAKNYVTLIGINETYVVWTSRFYGNALHDHVGGSRFSHELEHISCVYLS